MRHRLRSFALILALATTTTACGPSPGVVLQNEFKTSLPKGVRVVHYRADTLGMDPSFAWELAPIDEAFLTSLVTGGGLTRATPDNPAARTTYSWPAWWADDRLHALPEIYHAEGSALKRVFVDRERNRLFIEFLGL
jgi:hypothetical protein